MKVEGQERVFDPEHSELEKNPEKLRDYVSMLENAFGHQVKIVGILEIGSFAKGEAVFTSDIDTRIYVVAPNLYLFNDTDPQEQTQPLYERFIEERGALPRRDYTWPEFNIPVTQRITDSLSANIEFGFIDRRFAEFRLDNLHQFPSAEHSLLFQSTILYDPEGFLRQKRHQLKGRNFPSMAKFYKETCLDKLSGKIHSFFEPHPDDKFKIEKSGQIIWVQQAVRCLRNAVASKTYISSGEFIYKKADVLQFYQRYLPDDFAFVQKLYEWKTDSLVRENMVKEFLRDQSKFFAIFKEAMPQLEETVKKVGKLGLKC